MYKCTIFYLIPTFHNSMRPKKKLLTFLLRFFFKKLFLLLNWLHLIISETEHILLLLIFYLFFVSLDWWVHLVLLPVPHEGSAVDLAPEQVYLGLVNTQRLLFFFSRKIYSLYMYSQILNNCSNLLVFAVITNLGLCNIVFS